MAIEAQLRGLQAQGGAATLVGRWQNRLGSVMELEAEPGAQALRGTFRSGVGSPHPDRVYALAGYAIGDAFAFAVDFSPHGSVGAWSGHHVADERGERLVSLWHLARPVQSAAGDGDVWGAILAGADEFHRIG